MNKFISSIGLVCLLFGIANAEIISKDGIAKDTVTGLMWQDDADAATVKKDWNDAKHSCVGLRLGGFQDWRLPSIYELVTIIDSTKTSGPYVINGFENMTSGTYWSSSTQASDQGSAWFVFTNYGDVFGSYKNKDEFVRCVRGGQLNYEKLIALKKKNKVLVEQKQIDLIAPNLEAKRKKDAAKESQSKSSYASPANSWTVKSKFDNLKSYDPEHSAVVYNISCSNGNSDVVSYFYNKPQGIQYFATGKAGMATLDEAANYVCGNR